MEWLIKAVRSDDIVEVKFGTASQQEKLKRHLKAFESHKFVTLSVGEQFDQ